MVPTHHYLCPFSVDLFLLISWSRADNEDELEKPRQDFLADIRGKNLFLVRPVLAIGIALLLKRRFHDVKTTFSRENVLVKRPFKR